MTSPSATSPQEMAKLWLEQWADIDAETREVMLVHADFVYDICKALVSETVKPYDVVADAVNEIADAASDAFRAADQGGSRRKPPSATPQPKLVPVKQYEYEKARARCEHPMCCYPSCKCAVPFEHGGDIHGGPRG